ncbi:MAG TPA: pirin family protein [Burkholderiaceae bacterium]|nr:pirin family protein [Burkholderiaceae bacterium]
MITLRKSCDRGRADHGWLKSFHSFSFADYYDPRHMGVGNLRVINEDRIAPGTGFGSHPHRDMEILSVVLEGELAHRDSLGNGTAIPPGSLQRMTAGTGVRHSEYNHAADATTHFLQIWLLPSKRGLAPGYDQRSLDPARQRGRLLRVAAPVGQASADEVGLHADAALWIGRFDGPAEAARLALDPARKGYVFLARGRLQVNGLALAAGDALALADEAELRLGEGQGAEVLVFDLAP